MEEISQDDIRYKQAEKRVKQIKNFYIFLFVYVVVNIFILITNYRELKPGQTLWHLKYFSLPLFWGIGLLVYGLRVFVPSFILGNHWEEKKIQQLMDEEMNSRNRLKY
ncbi:2TM domain-containing protein [Chryseobacterium camelliae]|uniref:2TM domain-containing protein n=1 Tax=Chryseobacterium camelliae TaxID=1265445 RepID=UPI000C1CA8D9|nr:2TM domain-containing protein [Chryseobacterium camelliae]MDR6514976.1 hypothetical protein [Chryseobacterium camelliae]